MKVAFIHIPKTGGLAFGREGPYYRLLTTLHDYSYRKHFQEFPQDNYFTFSIVRNPWDRMVSIYEYLSRGQRPRYVRGKPYGVRRFDEFAEVVRDYSFSEFVKRFDEVRERCGAIDEANRSMGVKQRRYLGKVHFRTDYFLKEQVKFLLKDGKIAVDRLLRFEKYEEDVADLLRHLGVLVNPTIAKINTTNHKPYQSYYEDDVLIDAVKLIYRRDVEMLGYDFAP